MNRSRFSRAARSATTTTIRASPIGALVAASTTRQDFLASALIRSTPETPLADLQIFAVPADARGYYPGYSAFSATQKNRFSWLILKAHTQQ